MQNQNNARTVICTDGAPKAIGPYSQGIALQNLVFFSGQIAIDPATGKLSGDTCAQQTHRILQNIDALLRSCGLTAKNVVKTTVFTTDISRFSEINAAYAAYFTEDPPARSCVAVSALPMGALVEIEVIASLL